MECAVQTNPRFPRADTDGVMMECEARTQRTHLAVERVARESQCLADWLSYVYLDHTATQDVCRRRLFDAIDALWQQQHLDRVLAPSFRSLIPVLVDGFALTRGGHAELMSRVGRRQAFPTFTRVYLINALVEADSLASGERCEAYKQERRAYYRHQWPTWQSKVNELMQLLLQYDQMARTLFKNKLE
ncbi:hypothetical protein JTI77_10125 [Vibrio furnissii]|nr:hypothetical protein JTI73_10100 [Vibrio furnissii]QTG95278.1 hypothetical protein JTI77_10125 [Vibrio furnissii]